ncbi:MAG: substrate-binding domain-containing protein [Chloroflexota bacterium]|nr:substrate-binding domain-containing protein [Chloroflexota bacterium]
MPALTAILSLAIALFAAGCGGGNDVILATTTSAQDSGLFDELVPAFEKATGYNLKTIAVGSGQALALGERGEADVLLVHSPAAEEKFMAAGHGVDRRLVMYNDFLIVGPSADPAAIKGVRSATEALGAIADKGSLFVSRGDDSGTHQTETKLWQEIGFDPSSKSWYQEAGAGMGQTLMIASDKAAYTLTDRATYARLSKRLSLDPLSEGDPALLNIYHVIGVNPASHSGLNVEGAEAFADFLVSPQAQEMIRTFGVEQFGQPLFFAVAGQDESTLGR